MKLPETIEKSFQEKLLMNPVERQGSLSDGDGVVEVRAEDGFGWAELGSLEETCLFRTMVSWDDETQAVGLMIHTDPVSYTHLDVYKRQVRTSIP